MSTTMAMSEESIVEFYRNRSVLVTGFTGFLGKVLTEKLIRSCPDLQTVYVLVRPLKDKDSYQRVSKILESALFDEIRKEHPENLKKVVAVSGDIVEDNLGLSDTDKEMLTNTVTVAIHCAATVKFDEDLRFALQLNVVGVQRLLSLCHHMKNFAAFVHTSTAYANCNLLRVTEKVYPAPVNPKKLLASLEWMNDDLVRTFSAQLLKTHKRPNTYTFSKSLAEQLMVDESGHLPITIVRPSIIGATWKEPSPGWIDNLNGCSGLMTAQYKGLLRMIPLKEAQIGDVIPVDVVANTLIAAAWQRASMTGNPLPVIHCTSGQLNPVVWTDYRTISNEMFRKYPLSKQLRTPNMTCTQIKTIYTLNKIFNQYLPAYMVDFVAKIFGSKPILVRVMKRLEYGIQTVKFFMQYEWLFVSKNIINLHQRMSEEDRKNFNIDIRDMNWRDYIENYALGIRTHILKDGLSNLPAARAKAFRSQIMTKAAKIALCAFLMRLLIRKTKMFAQLWQHLINLFARVSSMLPMIKNTLSLTA